MSFQNLNKRKRENDKIKQFRVTVIFFSAGHSFLSLFTFVTTREFQEGRTRNAARGVVNLSLSLSQTLSELCPLFLCGGEFFVALREAVLTVRSVN